MKTKEYLIIYYSFTGNLESVIPLFQKLLDIEIVSLKLVYEYPKEGKDFIKRYRYEMANNILPAYKSINISIDNYDTIFIATSNWGNKVPPVVRSFLSNITFTNKRIIPIITHGGNGEVGIMEEIKQYTNGNTLSKPLVFKQENLSESELSSFLKEVL